MKPHPGAGRRLLSGGTTAWCHRWREAFRGAIHISRHAVSPKPSWNDKCNPIGIVGLRTSAESTHNSTHCCHIAYTTENYPFYHQPNCKHRAASPGTTVYQVAFFAQHTEEDGAKPAVTLDEHLGIIERLEAKARRQQFPRQRLLDDTSLRSLRLRSWQPSSISSKVIGHWRHLDTIASGGSSLAVCDVRQHFGWRKDRAAKVRANVRGLPSNGPETSRSR